MRVIRGVIRSAAAWARVLVVAWSVVSALAAVGVFLWMRERYGRSGPFPARDALALLNPQRRRLHPIGPTLRFFRIKLGDTVLELGPGPGYYTIDAARLVGPQGRVVSIDIQPGMVEVLAERLRSERADRARPIVGDATRLPLADDSIDAAFLVFVLGEIPDRPAALAELRRVLKPGGVLSLVETLTDSDYQLEASAVDLCRAFGFTELDRWTQRLGYARCFTAPADG